MNLKGNKGWQDNTDNLLEEDYDSDDFLDVEDDDEEENITETERKFSFKVNGKVLKDEEYDEYIRKLVNDYHSEDDYLKMNAAEEIIRSLGGLITSIINQRVDKSSQHYNDLVQEARIAVLMDLEKYDPDKARLSTFFFKRIKHAVHQYISEFINESSIYMQKNMKLVKDKINDFEQMKILNPNFSFTNEMIATETNLSIEQVKNIRILIARQKGKTLYEEEPYADNPEAGMPLKLADEQELLEDEILAKERIAFIRKAIQQLNSEEQQVILYAFGFIGNQRYTNGEIASKMGISKDMVIRIVNRAKDKLKKILSSSDMYAEHEKYIEKIMGDPLPLIPYEQANAMLEDIISSEIILNL